jgi:hypothetical protein
MSHAVVALATLILSMIWFCHLEGEVRKDYAKAGYIVIDKTAYKITKAE